MPRLQLRACIYWSSHIKCYPLFCLLVWKMCCPVVCVCVCLLMFYIMLHCLHHVDFLRIVQSWISTNGRHWHMKKRSGDLHQHDADDDEGTLWRKKDIEYELQHKGLDENTQCCETRQLCTYCSQPQIDFFVSLERNGPSEWSWLFIITLICHRHPAKLMWSSVNF